METERKLDHKPGEIVIYTNPEDGHTAKFQLDEKGIGCTLLAKGRRVERDITSAIDAMVIARQLSRNEISNKIGSWIEPCVQLEEGQLIQCPYRDLTAQTICKHPEDPPIPQDGKLECPVQKGSLRLIEHLTDT